jgi:hypothetical protein
MTDETISLLQRAAVAAVNELRRLNDAALFPPWLADAAEALGEVRPEDGAPLALNWTQVIAAIHELRDERDHWKANNDSWRAAYNQWQDWATELLTTLGLQPANGEHGDEPARVILAGLAQRAVEPRMDFGAGIGSR